MGENSQEIVSCPMVETSYWVSWALWLESECWPPVPFLSFSRRLTLCKSFYFCWNQFSLLKMWLLIIPYSCLFVFVRVQIKKNVKILSNISSSYACVSLVTGIILVGSVLGVLSTVLVVTLDFKPFYPKSWWIIALRSRAWPSALHLVVEVKREQVVLFSSTWEDCKWGESKVFAALEGLHAPV